MAVRGDGAFQRAPRPLMGWGGVALVCVCLLILLAISAIALYALWRWANGLPVDLTGFAAVMSAATAAGTAIWSLVKNYLQTRSYERVEQIRAGVAPAAPFVPPPSSGGTVNDSQINPHGGPDAP